MPRGGLKHEERLLFGIFEAAWFEFSRCCCQINGEVCGNNGMGVLNMSGLVDYLPDFLQWMLETSALRANGRLESVCAEMIGMHGLTRCTTP